MAGELEHRRRRVGREDPMAAVKEVPGEQPAPAPELDDQAVTCTHRCEQRRDPGCARVGVERVAAVVHLCEVVPVIGIAALAMSRVFSSRRRARQRR